MVKPSILIVEDEPSQREILCYNLEAEGYEVLIAENGEEALLVVDEASPDIILLDWMMPLVSGIEVCRRLKLNRETREIPIIMLSARSRLDQAPSMAHPSAKLQALWRLRAQCTSAAAARRTSPFLSLIHI